MTTWIKRNARSGRFPSSKNGSGQLGRRSLLHYLVWGWR